MYCIVKYKDLNAVFGKTRRKYSNLESICFYKCLEFNIFLTHYEN